MGRRRTPPERGQATPAEPADRGGELYIPEDPRATGGGQGALAGVVAGQKARRARGVGGGNEAALQAVVDQRVRNDRPRMAQRSR